MEVIFLLIFFSLVVALTFLYLFFWAVKSGQYDDDETPAMRILFDSKNSKTNNTNRDGQ
jgi:cbb3-type cytochrome oxidase maturation protein